MGRINDAFTGAKLCERAAGHLLLSKGGKTPAIKKACSLLLALRDLRLADAKLYSTLASIRPWNAVPPPFIPKDGGRPLPTHNVLPVRTEREKALAAAAR